MEGRIRNSSLPAGEPRTARRGAEQPDEHPSAPNPAGSESDDRRRTWLRAAADLATMVGLEQVGRARLAQHVEAPLARIEAEFDSDQALQLAAIEEAVRTFKQDILWPANRAAPGLARLRLLCSGFLEHVRRPTYCGGCFFASAASELDTRPGRPRERVLSVHRSWMRYLELCIREAQKRGEVSASEDVRQVAFEIDALLALGNIGFVLYQDAHWVVQAERGVERLIERLRPGPAKS